MGKNFVNSNLSQYLPLYNNTNNSKTSSNIISGNNPINSDKDKPNNNNNEDYIDLLDDDTNVNKKTSKKKPVTYSFMGFPIRHYNGTFYFREDDAKKYFGMMCLNYLVKDDDGDKYFLKEEYIKEIKLNGRDYQK